MSACASVRHQTPQADIVVSWRVWFASSQQQFQPSGHFRRLELCHPVPLPQITFQRQASSFSVPLRSDGECERERERLCLLRLWALSFQPSPPTTLWLLKLWRSRFLTEALRTQRFGFVLTSHQRWRLKPKGERWINNSLRQLNQLIQCRSAAWRFCCDLWVRAVFDMMPFMHDSALPSIFVCSAKTDPLFLSVLARVEKNRTRVMLAHFVIESLLCLF